MKCSKARKAKPPYRVLVCDDVAVIRRALQHLFSNDPSFELVGEAASGAESIEKAARLKPDLVLMDVCMPGMDGVEATKAILLAVPGTKVLAFSSDAAWETVERMFSAGADGYVVKGADFEEIIRAAQTVLSGGHYVSARLLEPTDCND